MYLDKESYAKQCEIICNKNAYFILSIKETCIWFQGYTIPLDKRLAADGRGLQQVHINENFAKLAESLYIADRKAREAVEMRAQLEKKLAQKEKEKKEDHLRQLAQKAREERAGLKSAATLGLSNYHLMWNQSFWKQWINTTLNRNQKNNECTVTFSYR